MHLYDWPLVFVLAGLALYVVLGGADFGAGLWQLLAGRGEGADEIRDHAHDSMAPVWEALTDILGAEQLRRRREKGEIEVAPIAFLRGRTLSHAFVICDEAQNATRLQMKMVLTRLGEGARMVVTGDPSQIDLVNARDSGLSHAVSLLEGVKGIAVTRFSAADVVRHPLVERIVRAYDADQAGPKT